MNLTKAFRARPQSISQLKYTANILKYQLFSTNVAEKIEIPNRVPRNATDILRALESTISRDPTAAHYKYHDDPYLIPMSNVGKRTFAMAQEAGRKAALWVRQQHPELFQHKEADPQILSFTPTLVFSENSDVSLADLRTTLDNIQVTDALLIYKLLKSKNVEIPAELQQRMLETLCYCNNEDTLSGEFVEERWFQQTSTSKERQRKTWKDGSFAEEIFISLENPSAEAYAALIQGMAKHFQVDRAWQLYEETQEKGLVLNTETYNALIKVGNFLKENYDLRWTYVLNLLTSLNDAKLKPNLGTLNSVLYTVSTLGGGKMAKDAVLNVLKEFHSLGIEPSLGSWYYVLITFCKERGPTSTILNDILPQLENKPHKIQDINDTKFFVTAMDICRNHLRDVELARRVHKLLNYQNNYELIGDSYKESIYYRHYFVLLCNNIPLEDFMNEIYFNYIPHIYVPEPSVMEEVLQQVDLNGAIEYLPKLWSDMVVFDQVKRDRIIDTTLNIMLNNEPPEDSPLIERFSYIAWDIHEKIENQSENRVIRLSFTGELLGKIMILVLRNNDYTKGCTIMDKLDKQQTNIVGVPKLEALSLFVDQCIANKAPSRAISCIQYCSDSGFPEAEALAVKLNEKLTLDEEHISRLTKIVGNTFIGNKTFV